jgi:pimeloyl-ACP methyl ester carboxylesterase
VQRATLVGHSLGGGVAMQFAWLFPERCERLVLVSSGGLGRDVSPILRAPTLPGAEWVLPLISASWLLRGGERLAEQLARFGLRSGPDLEELWRGYVSHFLKADPVLPRPTNAREPRTTGTAERPGVGLPPDP